jgi:hypothetical protein
MANVDPEDGAHTDRLTERPATGLPAKYREARHGVTDTYVARRVSEHVAAVADAGRGYAEQQLAAGAPPGHGQLGFYLLLGIVMSFLLLMVIGASTQRRQEASPIVRIQAPVSAPVASPSPAVSGAVPPIPPPGAGAAPPVASGAAPAAGALLPGTSRPPSAAGNAGFSGGDGSGPRTPDTPAEPGDRAPAVGPGGRPWGGASNGTAARSRGTGAPPNVVAPGSPVTPGAAPAPAIVPGTSGEVISGGRRPSPTFRGAESPDTGEPR